MYAEASKHLPVVWQECASMQLSEELGAIQGLQVAAIRPCGSNYTLKLVVLLQSAV